jgi:hypothetical protein
MNASRILATLLLTGFLISTPISAFSQRFVRAPIYSAGNASISVASGDFNGDGNPDLAFLSNTAKGVINVRLGTGNGKFTTGQQITLGYQATDIVAGDWNNDGVLDLAVCANALSLHTVAILAGNGNGTFTLGSSFDTGVEPRSLTAGDLNGDGITDLVSANATESVSVLLGLGSGNFSSPMVIPAGHFSSWGVALADVNRDGKLDIVAVADDDFDGESQLVVLLGNGDSTFSAPGLYDTVNYAESDPVVADFNGDGIPDVAINGNFVSVHIGVGDGTFQPRVMYPATPDEAGLSLLAADFNNDGKADLASFSAFANYLAVLQGNGDGTFKGPSLFGTGPCPYSAAAADFNKDGKIDLAIPDGCDSNFVLLAGDGTGKFTTRRDYASATAAVSVAAGYLDADKNLDLATVDGLYLSLLPGNKSGAFRVGTTYSAPASTWVAVGDVNGDGKNDVVTANGTNNTVSVYIGNGNGTLQPPISYATGTDPIFVAAVDVNGDGKLDLVTANKTGNGFSVLLASGSGYLPHVDYAIIRPVQIAFGDFNRDGKVDLVIGQNPGGEQIFLGNGDGTFSPGVTLRLGSGPVSVAVGDLNNDGRLDVVIGISNSTLIYSLPGNGDGTFGPPITSHGGVAVKHLMLGDFDADGKLDVMAAGGSTNLTGDAEFLPGKGDGTFRQAQLYTVDYTATAEAIGDFNSDGALDAAVVNGAAGTVSVLLNTGTK